MLQSIQKEDKSIDLEDFRIAIIKLFDEMMQNGHIKDRETLGKFARLRAHIIINLTDL